MKRSASVLQVIVIGLASLIVASYANAYSDEESPHYLRNSNVAYSQQSYNNKRLERENALFNEPYNASTYSSRLPQHISTPGEKVIIVNPHVHAWGAYDAAGDLVRGGLASAGSNWCSDLGRPCHTRPGSYRIESLGSSGCKSSKFPMPRGGAPMPYCMYFNRGEALHGSPDPEVVDGNVSHGCVRMHVQDAEWIRFNFATIGTRVIVTSD